MPRRRARGHLLEVQEARADRFRLEQVRPLGADRLAASFRDAWVAERDLRIDPELVAESLARAPRDFSGFAIAIRRWLEDAGR